MGRLILHQNNQVDIMCVFQYNIIVHWRRVIYEF